jgi:hypothetical protein
MEKVIEQRSPEKKEQNHQSNDNDYSTRPALEKFNESTRNHYVTRHGGGTQTNAHLPAAVGPMDHEA